MSIQRLVVSVGVVTALTLPMTALPGTAQTGRGAQGVMPCDAACTLRQDMTCGSCGPMQFPDKFRCAAR